MAALFFVLTGLLMLVGYAIGSYFGDPLAFLLLGLVLAGAVNIGSYYWSDQLVVRMTRAKLIQESDNPTLYGIVRKVANEANIPMPKVGIVESPQPNAFATGRGPNKAVVVATSGILGTLTPGELEAVIGHEIGHVVHRDVLLSSVAATMAGVISYIGNIALWSMMFGGVGGGNNRNGGNPLLFVAAIVLVPIGAMFVQLGISKERRVQRRRVWGQAHAQPRRSGVRPCEDLGQGEDTGVHPQLEQRPVPGDRIALDSQPVPAGAP